ncbi:hypothetical protein [Micromonospora chersina]|uniref:hypothetical protein n=1 Tax=Micromonospora chersina TaxID=47854 RepID=UPI0037153920
MIDDRCQMGQEAAVVHVAGRQTGLDYYLLLARTEAAHPGAEVEGVLVEEFVRHHDHSTVGLHGTVWTRTEPRWLSAASFSRALRTDPDLLARVVPTDRSGAEAAYGRLGGGPLPAEAALRAGLLDYEPFATAAPLRLGPTHPPDGFSEKRVYRVLFAEDLRADQLAALSASWQTTPDREDADQLVSGMPAGRWKAGDDLFTWNLRRVGRGIAWALDVTVLLATGADDQVGPVLQKLTVVVRRQGLVPMTTERFA